MNADRDPSTLIERHAAGVSVRRDGACSFHVPFIRHRAPLHSLLPRWQATNNFPSCIMQPQMIYSTHDCFNGEMLPQLSSCAAPVKPSASNTPSNGRASRHDSRAGTSIHVRAADH